VCFGGMLFFVGDKVAVFELLRWDMGGWWGGGVAYLREGKSGLETILMYHI
jgi:hypothetical protein